uniref:Uncharacterized protein n=1 Tax=Arundo donax TaxID=35708 RepID=A0A0A8ZCC5_ARUDO
MPKLMIARFRLQTEQKHRSFQADDKRWIF